ncbi:MAG: hypothetical protein SGBAC_000193 [Bacillariaceae sp.]
MSPRSPTSPSGTSIGILSRLEKLRARHKNVKKSTVAELAKSKESLVRERMARSQDLNWYSQRFNQSGRTFFMDVSDTDTGSEASKSISNSSSSSKGKSDAKKLPLQKIRERHKNVKKATEAELAKSKERLARERMAQSQGLNWYSQRFNESGRRFVMDISDVDGETFNSNSNSNSSKSVAKKLPLEKLSERRNNSKAVTKKLPLEKLPKKGSSVKNASVADPAKFKEHLVRERMARSQGLHWYSQRFNESGRRFYVDASDGASDGGGEDTNRKKSTIKPVTIKLLENLPERCNSGKLVTKKLLENLPERRNSGKMVTTKLLENLPERRNDSKAVTKKLPLKKLPEPSNIVTKATVGDPAKSKERLVRERMAQSQRLNWYSQRFNASGRRFYVDALDAEGEAGSSSNIKPVAKKVPLHVTLKKENERLRRKLEKTESSRKLLEKRVSNIGLPNLSTDKTILKTKLRETKAQYSNLERELSETKNNLSDKEASTVELMEKMKQMKEAYDTLARQMQSRRGSFSPIPEDLNVEELQTEVEDLKHDNKRLLLEKEISIRHGFNSRIDSISEEHFNGAQYDENDATIYENEASTTTVDLKGAEIKVAETGKELKGTQDALDHAQSLIEKLKWEKQNLATKMQNQLDRSHKSQFDASHRSTPDSSQQSTVDIVHRSAQKGISPRRKKTRALSMAMNEVSANGTRSAKDAAMHYDLSEVDPSESSLPHDYDLFEPADPSESSLPQKEVNYFADRRKWKRTASTLNQDLRALNGQDLNMVNQVSVFSTALFLICGFPLLALTFSVGSILVYGFQKDRTLPFHKDIHKYFLINCSGAIMSFGSWSLRAQAMEDPSRTLNFVFAALVREFSGFVLAWFIYSDYDTQDEPEALDIIEVKVKIVGGRDLVAKDKNFFGKAKSSDPYVQIYHARNYIGKTRVVWKTLNPVWTRETFSIMAVPNVLETHTDVMCHIYDHDTLSADDSMGTVTVPIPANFNEKIRKWYPVGKGSGDNYCRNASGYLDVEIVVLPRLSKEFKSQLSRAASFNETFRSAMEKKKLPVTHEVIQSLGEITAESESSRVLVPQAVGLRMFSGDCEPAERFRSALMSYRDANFSREIPSRFRKEILRPYVGENGVLHIEDINALLKNIGHEQDCLSEKEQNEFLAAAGSTSGSIEVSKMMELIH